MNNPLYNMLQGMAGEAKEEIKEKDRFVNFDKVSVGATRILISNLDDEKEITEIIDSLCKGGILTKEFVIEFKRYITPESFSSSPCLSLSLITKFPDLFDYDTWYNNQYISASVILSDGFDEEDILPILKHVYYKDLEKYSNEICNKYAKHSQEASEYILRTFPNLNADSLIENISCIRPEIFQNEKMCKTFKADMSIVDRLFTAMGNSVTLNFVLAALGMEDNESNIGWQLKTIREFKTREIRVDGDIIYDLVRSINNIHEKCVKELIQLVSDKNNGVVPYAALALVIGKDLDEDELCELSPIFVRNGAGGPLLKYASTNKYETLTQILQISLF